MELTKLAASLSTTCYNLLKRDYPPHVLAWVKSARWSGPHNVPLSEIKMARRPGGREMDKVKGIAQAVRSGQKMDPIFLVKTSDGRHKVADGYHRSLGHQHAGKDSISAYVAETGVDDGPWDREMHDAKLNVGMSKKAFGNKEGDEEMTDAKYWIDKRASLTQDDVAHARNAYMGAKDQRNQAANQYSQAHSNYNQYPSYAGWKALSLLGAPITGAVIGHQFRAPLVGLLGGAAIGAAGAAGIDALANHNHPGRAEAKEQMNHALGNLNHAWNTHDLLASRAAQTFVNHPGAWNQAAGEEDDYNTDPELRSRIHELYGEQARKAHEEEQYEQQKRRLELQGMKQDNAYTGSKQTLLNQRLKEREQEKEANTAEYWIEKRAFGFGSVMKPIASMGQKILPKIKAPFNAVKDKTVSEVGQNVMDKIKAPLQTLKNQTIGETGEKMLSGIKTPFRAMNDKLDGKLGAYATVGGVAAAGGTLGAIGLSKMHSNPQPQQPQTQPPYNSNQNPYMTQTASFEEYWMQKKAEMEEAADKMKGMPINKILNELFETGQLAYYKQQGASQNKDQVQPLQPQVQ